jgi:serine/threonine protein kinase
MFYGLRHIHEKGYVHLDIKPDNILVTKDLQLKIADFGLSQPLKGEDDKGTFNKRRCGTKAFWSPEIALGFEYNGEQADLYALAIILFIMVFGCRPFREIKIDDPLFMKLLKEPLAFWMAHPVTRSRIKDRTVSEEVVDLLARMLLVNPEDRLSKHDIAKHPWMLKFNKDIYEENDFEEFEFAPEILEEEDDSDYVISEEDLKSSESEGESEE